MGEIITALVVGAVILGLVALCAQLRQAYRTHSKIEVVTLVGGPMDGMKILAPRGQVYVNMAPSHDGWLEHRYDVGDDGIGRYRGPHLSK